MTDANSLPADWKPMAMAALPPEPIVSVLVPNYNHGQFVGDAIESVLAQSYSRLEVVVCDDGSTDDSVDVVSSYAATDGRVRLVVIENSGQGSALNAAYLASKGEILCILDADDWFAAGKVRVIVDAWRSCPQSGMVCHPMSLVDRDGTRVGLVPEHRKLERGWIARAVQARGGRWISPPSGGICLHRTLAQVVFPIPPHPFRLTADWYVYTLAALLSEIESIDEPMAFYRIHAANSSRQVHHWDLSTLSYTAIAQDIRARHSWI